MHKRFTRVFTSIKENTRVNYARIATVGGFCDIDIILVKATSPEDLPLRDRYVLQILKIFTISPLSYRTFASSFARRFSKTKCWRVALKCLILLHRLLRALPENSPLRTELLWTRSNGFLSLNPCHFLDSSSSYSNDYTHFISSYANLLDEALDCLSINCKDNNNDAEEESEDEEEKMILESFPDKMKQVGEKLEILPEIQSLIDRVIECRPRGAAERSFLIHCAMKYILRDSFFCYLTFRSEMVTVLEYLIQLPYRSCAMAFGVYKKAAVQADCLCQFYDWCKSLGFCGIYEYPSVDRIPDIQIQALENFLNGMWQLTDSCSSTGSPVASSVESSFSSMDDQGDKQLVRFNNWVQFEDTDIDNDTNKNEEQALIQFESANENGVSWEVLLEASVILAPLLVSNNYFYFQHNSDGVESHDSNKEIVNDLQIQVYNPCVVNPFHQANHMNNGFSTLNTTYP